MTEPTIITSAGAPVPDKNHSIVAGIRAPDLP
jgi:hypothetical protein